MAASALARLQLQQRLGFAYIHWGKKCVRDKEKHLYHYPLSLAHAAHEVL